MDNIDILAKVASNLQIIEFLYLFCTQILTTLKDFDMLNTIHIDAETYSTQLKRYEEELTGDAL